MALPLNGSLPSSQPKAAWPPRLRARLAGYAAAGLDPVVPGFARAA
jgi:hypothetical protein